VHDHSQAGCEPSGFGRPVAHHCGRCDDQRGALAGGPGQVGQHGGRLAQTHVERQAATELGGVEEADPGQRFDLVRAQLAHEALRLRHRVGGRFGRPAQHVVGPALAVHADAAGEAGRIETHAVAQDLGAGHLLLVLALGQRGGRLLQVDAIEFDPLAVRLHQRPRLLGQTSHFGPGELDVVEQHRPGDAGELVHADHRAGGVVGEQTQRRGGLAPRDLRRTHVEPGGCERGPDQREEVPRFVLAERELTASANARAPERGEDAPETCPLGHGRAAALLRTQCLIDGNELALGLLEVHRHQPHATGAGRIELHHEARVRGVGDGARPLLEAASHVARERDVGREGHTVEASQHGVAEVGDGLRRRRLRLQLDSLCSFRHDGFHHGTEHGRGGGVRRSVADDGDRAGHHGGQFLDHGAADERRDPTNRGVGAVAVASRRDLQAGHHRATGNEPHTFDRRATQPQQAGADALGRRAATDRHQPPQRTAHGNRNRLRFRPVGQRHAGVQLPAVRRPTHGLQPGGQLVVGLALGATTGGPHHHQVLRPRCLQFHRAGFEVLPGQVVVLHEDGRGGQRAQACSGAVQALQRLGEVGHHLVAFFALDAAYRREVLLCVADQPIEDCQRAQLVGCEQRQLIVRGAAVGNRPDGRFELSYLNHCTPSELPP
jgi:hypothetical protein